MVFTWTKTGEGFLKPSIRPSTGLSDGCLVFNSLSWTAEAIRKLSSALYPTFKLCLLSLSKGSYSAGELRNS